MRPCTAILTLFVAPLVVGGLIGLAIANSVLVALEDAQRERRRREEERVTRDTELRWMIFDTHERGPVIETIWTGTTPDGNTARN